MKVTMSVVLVTLLASRVQFRSQIIACPVLEFIIYIIVNAYWCALIIIIKICRKTLVINATQHVKYAKMVQTRTK